MIEFQRIQGVEVSAIAFDLVHAGDQITVRTAEEEYSLLITSAERNHPLLAAGYVTRMPNQADGYDFGPQPLAYQIAIRGSGRVAEVAFTTDRGETKARKFPLGGTAARLAIGACMFADDRSGEGSRHITTPILSLNWLVNQSA